jgi:hypothetical protein
LRHIAREKHLIIQAKRQYEYDNINLKQGINICGYILKYNQITDKYLNIKRMAKNRDTRFVISLRNISYY